MFKTLQKEHIVEKTLLLCASGVLIIGFLYVAGSMIFNDTEAANIPGDLFAPLFLVPLLITIPLFLIRYCLFQVDKTDHGLKTTPVLLLSVFLILTTTYGQYLTTYNYFIRANESIEKQYSVIDVAYQKRFNLIPNIVRLVRAYSDFEQGVVGQITDARRAYTDADTIDQKVSSANQFDATLHNFVLTVENYPNLKSDTLYLQLLQSLIQSEEEIVAAKKTYNNEVGLFNQNYKIFPNILVGRLTGYKEKVYLRSEFRKEVYDSKGLLEGLDKKQ